MTRKILTALLISVATLCQCMAQGTATSVQPADSASAAIATVWGDYMRPQLVEQFDKTPDGVDEYFRGIRDAFSRSHTDQVYLRGLYEGISLAFRIGELADMGITIDSDSFVTALKAAVTGQPTGFTPESANRYLESLFDKRAAVDSANVAFEEAFIAREAAREGVITTPSGLLFEVITEGEGATPSHDSTVAVTYTGRLSDGSVFDETDHGPAQLPLSALIPGMQEGIAMMKPGGTYRIIIPADIAYGKEGFPGRIPANSTLDFTVHLIGVID